MTKRTLLAFLEPLPDDIEVLVSLDAGGGLFEFEPRYYGGTEGTDEREGDEPLAVLQLTAEAS